MDITMRPIGYIHSPLKTQADAPRQSVYNANEQAVLEMLDEYKEGIMTIEPDTYIQIFFYFDRSETYSLSHISHDTGKVRGVFSSRSPRRPNGIGLSIVKVLKNDGKSITFEGVDMLDNTPVLDIKPYSPHLNPKE